MKKLPAFIIAGAVAAALTTAASAHCMRSARCADVCGQCGYVNRWLDEDGDGVCDYHINVCAGGKETCDSDGDGVCDFCEKDCMYIDEDGDGVCDSYQKHICVSSHHGGRHGHGSHHSSHHGC